MGSPLSCQSYQHDFLKDLLNNYSSPFKLLKVELAYQASPLTLARKICSNKQVGVPIQKKIK